MHKSSSEEYPWYLGNIYHSLLSAEEEHAYLLRAQAGDKEAQTALIEANLRLLISVARDYCPEKELLDGTYVNEGSLGLLTAISRFNTSTPYRLSTYAISYIRTAISQYKNARNRQVSLPDYLIGLVNKMHILRADTLIFQEREPHEEEYARLVDLSPARIRELLPYLEDVASLETPLRDAECLTLADEIPDPTSEQERTLEHLMRAELLADLIQKANLTSKEQAVLTWRYGFQDGIPRTHQQIAHDLNCSTEMSRKLQERALGKLRLCAAHLSPEEQDDLRTIR